MDISLKPTRFDSVLDAALCARWLAAIDGTIARFRETPHHPDFSRYSSSLRLHALSSNGCDTPMLIGQQVRHGALRATLAGCLGTHLMLMVDQCWARQQYAPHRYPPDHTPHGWHQDGALHLDFAAPQPRLLNMVTCWIALTPAGDVSPGLELIPGRLPYPLQPDELTADAVAARFGSADPWRPVMKAGDALLFDGNTLHRTFVEPAMRADRTSIELRFVAAGAQPARLRDETLVVIE